MKQINEKVVANAKKLLSSINEVKASPEVVEKLIKTITKFVDRNFNTEAILEIAKFVKDTQHMKILQAFIELHGLYGSMPSQLIELRGYELKELIKLVEKQYGRDVAERIQSAF
jgi:hypothetical protein